MLNFAYPSWFGLYSFSLFFLYETLVIVVEFAILRKLIDLRFRSLGERQFIPPLILLLSILAANIASFFVISLFFHPLYYELLPIIEIFLPEIIAYQYYTPILVVITLPFGIAIELGVIILLFHFLDLYPKTGLLGTIGLITFSVILGNIITGLLILPLIVLLGQYLMIFFYSG